LSGVLNSGVSYSAQQEPQSPRWHTKRRDPIRLSRGSCISTLANGHDILVPTSQLRSEDALTQSMVGVFVVEGDLERRLRVSCSRGLRLKLLLCSGAGLLPKDPILLVMCGQHCAVRSTLRNWLHPSARGPDFYRCQSRNGEKTKVDRGRPAACNQWRGWRVLIQGQRRLLKWLAFHPRRCCRGVVDLATACCPNVTGVLKRGILGWRGIWCK